MGLSATLLCADAGELHNSLDHESFERILVDAPCSATGVIRRHPDIKSLRRTDDIGPLAEQQLQILKGLWPLLRPGGSLLYATCSVLEQENSRVVAAFLTSETSAAGADLPLSPGVPVTHGRQLLPAQHGPDGLFYAVLHKSS